MRISDWSSDVCSSDLGQRSPAGPDHGRRLHSSGRSRGPRGGRCRMTGASGPRTGLPAMRRFDPKRLWALVRKESLQRSEEHTSELQSLMRISYAVFCLKKKNTTTKQTSEPHIINKKTNKHE